ncbi:MAG: DNA-protecting protein DprA [Rhodobacteraceae bacterium]|nr:DNA-protecting protein DprA [Paracoccaceae bacterium]
MNPSATHSQKIPPSALPQSESEILAWLRLARSRRVGPSTFIRLLREHKNAEAALAALPEVASLAGAKSYMACRADQANAEMEAGFSAGAELLCLGTPEYPPHLALIADPPPVLWAIGDPALAQRPTVGLVGARNASSLGQRMARILAKELGPAGYIIASGLARGVDTAAHIASLETGTIAVLAGGVDVVYPRENKGLWEQICHNGLVVSEAPIGTSPQARHFPKRNRIISGMSLGIVVIEGAAKSGSLITARNALDQGREVMAIPGSPLDPRATGCNMLLRDGAGLVLSGADVIEYLESALQGMADFPAPVELTAPQIAHSRAATESEPLQPTASSITPNLKSLLSTAPVPEDTLIRESGLPTPKAMELIFDLELAGEITRHPGGLLSLAT